MKTDPTVRLPSVADVDDVTGMVRFALDAHPGEPLFVIRGRDALAVPTLREYAVQCAEHGLSGQENRAWVHIDKFRVWQTVNAKLTHLPDPLPTDDTPTTEG